MGVQGTYRKGEAGLPCRCGERGTTRRCSSLPEVDLHGEELRSSSLVRQNCGAAVVVAESGENVARVQEAPADGSGAGIRGASGGALFAGSVNAPSTGGHEQRWLKGSARRPRSRGWGGGGQEGGRAARAHAGVGIKG